MQIVLIGAYTDFDNRFGLHVFELDAHNKVLTMRSSLKIANASFVISNPEKKLLYIVNENHADEDQLTYVAYNDSYDLKLLGVVSSGGTDPCYLSCDANFNHLFVANYSSGSLKAIPISPEGNLSHSGQIIQHPLKKDNLTSSKSHMHATLLSKDDAFLLVSDLGLNTISVYKYNPLLVEAPLEPSPRSILKFESGTGPRHLKFSWDEKYVYVVGELDGSLNVLSFSKGRLKFLKKYYLMDEKFKGRNSAAEIQITPDGNFLYVSNRGDANVIITYKITDRDGGLEKVSVSSTLGVGPRNFSLNKDGTLMLVANQDSNNLMLFDVNKEQGTIQFTGRDYILHSPVFVKFL